MVRYSRRVPSDLRPNRIAETSAGLGAPHFDLTESNPTRCDLPYPEELLKALTHPFGIRYEPEPRGLESARNCIADWYREFDADIDPRGVVLTTSTSEAYGFLLRALVDPGCSILVPSPSYPLFEQLTRLDGVRAETYQLDADAHWRIDPSTITEVPDDCRAIIAVHPNNPTGSSVHPDDADLLTGICLNRGLALIVDEVFLPYPLPDATRALNSFAGNTRCLTFTLGGVSKSLGLPQMKLAWINVSGPRDEVDDSLERLDYVADAYLSVSTPVAHSLPELMRRCRPVQTAIRERCRNNILRLRTVAETTPSVTVPAAEGGWSAVLRIPSVIDEEELAITLLERYSVAVHPGFLFDFPTDGYLVVSLLPPEQVFAEGLKRLFDTLDRLGR